MLGATAGKETDKTPFLDEVYILAFGGGGAGRGRQNKRQKNHMKYTPWQRILSAIEKYKVERGPGKAGVGGGGQDRCPAPRFLSGAFPLWHTPFLKEDSCIEETSSTPQGAVRSALTTSQVYDEKETIALKAL